MINTNECPKKKQDNLTDYKEDRKKEVERIEELDESYFAKKQGDSIAF